MRNESRTTSTFIAGFKLVKTLLFVAIIGLAACVQNPRPDPYANRPQETYLQHTVRYQGETLALIASWYTGSSRNWENILDHNPGLDVRRIRIGDIILIPDSLVVKSDPLPRNLVGRVAASEENTKQDSVAVLDTSDQPASLKENTDESSDNVSVDSQDPSLDVIVGFGEVEKADANAAAEDAAEAAAEEAKAAAIEAESARMAAEAQSEAARRIAEQSAAKSAETAPAFGEALDTADKGQTAAKTVSKSREQLLKELLEE